MVTSKTLALAGLLVIAAAAAGQSTNEYGSSPSPQTIMTHGAPTGTLYVIDSHRHVVAILDGDGSTIGGYLRNWASVCQNNPKFLAGLQGIKFDGGRWVSFPFAAYVRFATAPADPKRPVSTP